MNYLFAQPLQLQHSIFRIYWVVKKWKILD